MNTSTKDIVLFDGVCKFCNATVNFILDRDKHDRFQFAPLQSERGTALLREHGLDERAIDTIVLIEAGGAYTKSTAALRIARHLKSLWPLVYAFIVVPKPIRDWAYDAFAKRRYKWFGKLERCMVPGTDVKSRFLE